MFEQIFGVLTTNMQMLLSGILLASVFGALVVVYAFFNNKYPLVKFEVYEGKLKRIGYRRLFGNKIVPDDLISIVMKGESIPGLSITDFDFVYVPVPNGVERVYIAKKVGDELIPIYLKTEQDILEAQKVNSARQIAIKYANTIEETEAELKHKNKILEAVVSGLPLFLSIIIVGAILYFLTTALLTGMKDAASGITETAKLNKETAEILAEIIKNLNTTKNQTTAVTPPFIVGGAVNAT